MDFPIPQDDESLERYTIRCATVASDLDPDDFNNLVWSTWEKYRGPTDEQAIAVRKFDPERYMHVPGVCVFAEHKTTTAGGKKRKYTLKDLARIVRGNNDRIGDVDAFPVISDGHTSNPGEPNAREPKILGYAGNYRLGRIGRKKPRWAIFQDEYHRKDRENELADKPRRSVELWTFSDGRAHFDPVAAIGAEAPRLPLPQRFSVVHSEQGDVERYTFDAGSWASPSAGSTHVPSHKTKDKYEWKDAKVAINVMDMKNYGKPGAQTSSTPQSDMPKQPPGAIPAMDLPSYGKSKSEYSAGPVDSAPTPKPGGTNMPRLAPEDIQEIVAAIAETPQWNWLTEKMEAEQRQGSPGTEDNLGVEAEGDDFDEPEVDPDDDGMADLEDLLGPDEDESTVEPSESGQLPEPEGAPIPKEPEEKNRMPYSQKSEPAATVDKGKAKAIVERYTALQSSHDSLIKDFGRAQDRIIQLERRNADNDRRRRIEQLAHRFPAVDVDEECQKTLYSLNADMSDEQFDDHIATVEKYAERFAKASVYIPEGDAPTTEANPEKYAESQRINQIAVKIHGEALGRGEKLTYDEARAQAKKRLSES